MYPLYRKSLIPKDILGIDSIQGYLEMSEWYQEDGVNIVCDTNDKSNHSSMYFVLNQLESDAYINIEWENYESQDNQNMVLLKQISLTIQGHKLLDELKNKSKVGSIKKRTTDLLWVILTTICTTLIVLKIKGL